MTQAAGRLSPHQNVPPISLSMLPAGTREKRLAFAVVTISTVFFVAALPFAKVRLSEVWPFIPIYEAALGINDLITAVLLLAQYTIVRARALLVLACGYFFTALIVIPHVMSYPGVFAPTGLMGSGPQTTAWLYIAWHALFPVFVLGYALLRGENGWRGDKTRPGVLIAGGLLGVVVLTLAITALTTLGHNSLPAFMIANHYSSSAMLFLGGAWLFSFAALAVLWLRKPHSILDIWLMVVMCAWIFDVALSAVFNAGRFDLGFYAGRVYGFLAASFVLIVLLLETGALYARLVHAAEIERNERERQLKAAQGRLEHLSRVNELGQMVTALVHEVKQPLTALSNYIRTSGQFVHFDEPAKAKAELARAAEQARRASTILERLRDYVKRGEVTEQNEDLSVLIEEIVPMSLAGLQGENIRMNVILHPKAWLASIDKLKIQQVLHSLIKNAIEATAGQADREIDIATMLAGDMIEIVVSDNGPGLAPHVHEQLFEPFVTTKPNGMGVGLSICRSIVEQHGGRVWADTEAQRGTAFHFTVRRGQSDEVDVPDYLRNVLAPPARVMSFTSEDETSANNSLVGI